MTIAETRKPAESISSPKAARLGRKTRDLVVTLGCFALTIGAW